MEKVNISSNISNSYTENESEYIEFIPLNATPQEIKCILADKKQMGRQFLGFKEQIKLGIENSKNPQLAIENLNFLLNVMDKKLPANLISQILGITEGINNGSNITKTFYIKKYKFEGGILTKENLDNILKKNASDMVLIAMNKKLLNELNQENKINIESVDYLSEKISRYGT